jgi:hypothetical protein
MTPSSIIPLNVPPFLMLVVGYPKYVWLTYSALARTFGVMNQPPPNCQRFAPTSPAIPASSPCALL